MQVKVESEVGGVGAELVLRLISWWGRQVGVGVAKEGKGDVAPAHLSQEVGVVVVMKMTLLFAGKGEGDKAGTGAG